MVTVIVIWGLAAMLAAALAGGPRPRRPSLDELDRLENRDLPH